MRRIRATAFVLATMFGLTAFEARAQVPVIEPRSLGGGVSVYDSPAPEFRLYHADLGPGETLLPGAGGARIVLCADGAGFLRAGQATGAIRADN